MFIPFSKKALKERDRLARNWGILVLAHGDIDVEGHIETLREMSESFGQMKWEWFNVVIESTSSNFPEKGFNVNIWTGEKGLLIHLFRL